MTEFEFHISHSERYNSRPKISGPFNALGHLGADIGWHLWVKLIDADSRLIQFSRTGGRRNPIAQMQKHVDGFSFDLSQKNGRLLYDRPMSRVPVSVTCCPDAKVGQYSLPTLQLFYPKYSNYEAAVLNTMKIQSWQPSLLDWLSSEYCKQRGFYPNRIAHCKTQNQAIIQIKRSQNGEHFSLSQAAVIYCLNFPHLEVRTRLVERDGIFIKDFPLSEIFKNIGSRGPTDGRFGNYWWIDIQGRCVS